MKCPACNTEFPDFAHFCPNCGFNAAEITAAAAPAPTFQSDAAETQAFVSYDPYSSASQAASSDPLQTQILQPQQTEAFASPYAAATQQPQTQSPYAGYGQAPSQQPPLQPQPPMQRAYGAPEPPRGYSGYGSSSQSQPIYGGQAPQPSAQQYPSYASSAAPVATQRKKTPLIMAIAIIVAIVAVLGVCAAMGAGPFGGNGRIGNTGDASAHLNPNADPIAQLDAAVQDIEGSGNFEGEFSMDMALDMGDVGAAIGMSDINVDMNGSYWMENYFPDDLSNLKMHMSMDVDAMGEESSYVIDFADGEATMTSNGETETVSYSAEDIADLVAQTGGMAYDSETIGEYIKSSRVDGDTIVIELDEDFINKVMADALGGEGLEGMDASIDGFELRAKVGDGTVDENMDMAFNMSYMGYDMSASLDMDLSMAKR